MSLFVDFLEEEVVLLVSMPYRIGLWISQVDDDEATERDDEREQRALEAALTTIAKNKKQPFVASIVRETLTYKNMWAEWGAQPGPLLDDVRQTMRMVEERMAVDNIENFRKGMLYIARAVALAYGEFEEAATQEKPSFFGVLMTKISDRVHVLPTDPNNISEAEEEALKKLREALQA